MWKTFWTVIALLFISVRWPVMSERVFNFARTRFLGFIEAAVENNQGDYDQENSTTDF